ncbi:hypothetical protein DTX80_07940 [Bacilli bacterium]|nr:hypothetical protein DEJ64_08405 [Bacilli bacterium]PZD89420.1 hypothetical protein DEJ60_05155 [Bacilli bacterium]PZD90294.1 hypothetical protein DEJ66_10265 [Bacilli bacterium]RCO06135.1 hypothetical protein DTX80_07940 [Bacilli bacterium]RCO10768.1 hypothetical protein DTX79_02790 [Bacilli bacterium]
MLGYNKAGEAIAYARFSMGNSNATILYDLLDSIDYHAGVSGTGAVTTFSKQQIEKALHAYKQQYGNDVPSSPKGDSLDLKQIQDFLSNCLEEAQKEKSVTVFFG